MIWGKDQGACLEQVACKGEAIQVLFRHPSQVRGAMWEERTWAGWGEGAGTLLLPRHGAISSD